MRELPEQCNQNQKAKTKRSRDPVYADCVSGRRVFVVDFRFSASVLCAPIAAWHALRSMASAGTFLQLASPFPQGMNKESLEALWACVHLQMRDANIAPPHQPMLLSNVSIRLFFFKASSFKAFCSKRFLQRILKDIKGSRNQTSCCETLTRRNLSATKSATYVHLVFPKI